MQLERQELLALRAKREQLVLPALQGVLDLLVLPELLVLPVQLALLALQAVPERLALQEPQVSREVQELLVL